MAYTGSSQDAELGEQSSLLDKESQSNGGWTDVDDLGINVLNDGSTNVDLLGHIDYAKALAQQIQRVKTPMTVGIFARWGSGKSFLLKHVQNLVAEEQEKSIREERGESKKQYKKQRDKKRVTILTWICLIFAFLTCLILTIIFMEVVDAPPLRLFFVGLSIVVLLITLLIFVENGSTVLLLRFKWVILSALFTKLPIQNSNEATIRTVTSDGKDSHRDKQQQTEKACVAQEQKENSLEEKKNSHKKKTHWKKSRRFIFVNFNAWKFAGSDKLWAGIVTALAENIENEFGVFTTRLFRSLSLDTSGFTNLFLEISQEELKEKMPEIMKKYQLHGDGDPNKSKDVEMVGKRRLDSNKPNRYKMTFSSTRDAANAMNELKQQGIKAEYTDWKTMEQEGKNYNKQELKIWRHFLTYPRCTCDVPNWIWCACFTLGCVIVPIATFLSIDMAEEVTTELHYCNESINLCIVGKVLSMLPLGISVGYTVLQLFMALLFSQKSRVMRALKGVKVNMANELGFMKKIKDEVQAITNLLHTVEFTTNIEYKVVLTVDDLDRVPLPKVRAVLEAINILLSDQNSPFICLIAIDSRIAVKCFESQHESRNPQAGSVINGHEYLKKIINLPFCLPEIKAEAKATFVCGLTDEVEDILPKKVVSQHAVRPTHLALDSKTISGVMRHLRKAMELSKKERKLAEEIDQDLESKTLPDLLNDLKKGMEEVQKQWDEEKKRGNVEEQEKKEPLSLDSKTTSDLLKHLEKGMKVLDRKFRQVAERVQQEQKKGAKQDEKAMDSKTIPDLMQHLEEAIEIFKKRKDEGIAMDGDSQEATHSRDDKWTNSKDKVEKGEVSDSTNTRDDKSTNSKDKIEEEKIGDSTSISEGSSSQKATTSSSQQFSLDDFLRDCRRYMHTDKTIREHLYGNPRNIKRIFNIISMTSSVIQSHYQRLGYIFEEGDCTLDTRRENNQQSQETDLKLLWMRLDHKGLKELAKDLVLWVIITDQWPFRASYLIQMIEDSEYLDANFIWRLPPDREIIDTYRQIVVKDYLSKDSVEIDKDLMMLDFEPGVLDSLLEKSMLTKQKVLRLLKFSINIDRNLRQTISHHIEKVNLMRLKKDELSMKEMLQTLLNKNGNGISDLETTGKMLQTLMDRNGKGNSDLEPGKMLQTLMDRNGKGNSDLEPGKMLQTLMDMNGKGISDLEPGKMLQTLMDTNGKGISDLEPGKILQTLMDTNGKGISDLEPGKMLQTLMDTNGKAISDLEPGKILQTLMDTNGKGISDLCSSSDKREDEIDKNLLTDERGFETTDEFQKMILDSLLPEKPK